LKVIGVSAFFFLPALVAALTSADEFHSVTKTLWPLAASHLASSPSCVVLPDPSIPSTTNSRPAYAWGVLRVSSMRGHVLDAGGSRRSRAGRRRQRGTSLFDALPRRRISRGQRFEPDFRPELLGECRRMAMGGPELELRVAGGMQPNGQRVRHAFDGHLGD